MSWDDIEILRRIDGRQLQYGGGALTSVNGKDLMDEIAGTMVTEDRLHRGFVRELHNARDAGYLLFTVDKMVGGALPDYDSKPYFYLQQVRGFALTTAGQDRARGRVVQTAPPDPGEDDGRAISRLVCKKVAESIENEYRPDQIPLFLEEAGVPLDRLPLPDVAQGGDVNAVLAALDQWGSEGRRILRTFLGRWLDNRLHTGPDDELRVTIIDQLARQGWFVTEERLVVGEPAAGTRVSSPGSSGRPAGDLSPRGPGRRCAICTQRALRLCGVRVGEGRRQPSQIHDRSRQRRRALDEPGVLYAEPAACPRRCGDNDREEHASRLPGALRRCRAGDS